MSLSVQAVTALRSHWALEAVGVDDVQRAHDLVNELMAQQAVGRQIEFSFATQHTDCDLLDRVALGYEMAAIEGLDALSSASGNSALAEQATAAAHCAYDFRKLKVVPRANDERLFHVLQFSALAYCGERWSDLRRWYKENGSSLAAPSTADARWDHRLLYRIFDCWVRLFRKEGWDDLDRIREIIAGLREDQKIYEQAHLNAGPEAADRAMAFRLIALYHWAKATEILAQYMLQGDPPGVLSQVDKHFEASIRAATAAADAKHEMVLRWLHAAGRIMVTSSLWWGTRTVNSRVSRFVRSLTHREHRPMFDLLPPQRAALLEQGLLDQAKTAIVVDMPTSGGKTLLAQFRILQALNQFNAEKGWVVYVAPTRALSAQITRRLRQDFEPIGVRVEQLTAAIDIDAFEEKLLVDAERGFDVLVATPEKLALVIRNKKVSRPLALAVMDEAHNIENESRGLRIELLLSTIKSDCPQANFLLLMPFVENGDSIAKWLAQDVNAGRSISFSTTAWKPNERIIGLYRAVADDSERAGWRLEFETLTATAKAMDLRGIHLAGGVRPIKVPKSEVISKGSQKGYGLQTAAMSAVMSTRGPSIAVGSTIPIVWNMARHLKDSLPSIETVPSDIRLVQDFLKTEISENFELINMLDHGVGVHHAGLSDEIRALMEWLAEAGQLKVLCATSTISQGINFPVSSIFLASRFIPQRNSSTEMAPREFWNLVGRAGRIGHDSVGVVGLSESNDREKIIDFVRMSTGQLVSRLVTLMDQLVKQGETYNLTEVLWQDQWEDFRCYIAHLWAEKKNLDAVLADSEQLLRQTYGYTTMRNDPAKREKADALLAATQNYARRLAELPAGVAELADSTGFSPEGITAAMAGVRNLEDRLTPSDWTPESLFGEGGKIAGLFGVMLQIPQLKKQLEDLSGRGNDHVHISNITKDWVNGARLEEIAKVYFSNGVDAPSTAALTEACKAIYRTIANHGTWGVSALTRLSGLDFETMSIDDQRRINAIPAMIYHGVRTEEAVLMRMNSVPRSASESLGTLYRATAGNEADVLSVGAARNFLKELDTRNWDRIRPENARLSGAGYRRIWEVLSGDGR